MVNNYLIYKYY